MQYDPIKDKFSSLIEVFPPLRKVFFMMLDLLLLRQRYVKKSIQKYIATDAAFRFYDAGAGFCQYSDFVLNQYPLSIVHAVDLKTDYLISYASALDQSKRKRFSYSAGDLQVYEPKKLYDLVCAIDILEHIEDDIATLQHFHQCMHCDALLIISTPSDLDEAAKFTAEHVRPGYNKKELETKLQNSGFEICESLYTYGKWGGIAWKLLMKTPLNLISQSKIAYLILPFYYAFIFPIANLMMIADIKTKNKSGTGILVIARKSATYSAALD